MNWYNIEIRKNTPIIAEKHEEELQQRAKKARREKFKFISAT